MRRSISQVIIGVMVVGVLVGLVATGGVAWIGELRNQPTAQAQVIPGPVAPLAASAVGASTVSGGNWQMTGITSGTAVAVTVPARTGRLSIQAEGGNLRWTSDGTSPTSSVGTIIYAGDTAKFTASLAAIELIATSTTAKANLHGANR